MIHFIPDYDQGMNQRQIDEVQKWCNELNISSKQVDCKDHVGVESTVLIATGSNGIGFKIFDTCCSGFRQILIEYFGEAVYT
jgi:hypothetical protein